MPRKIKIVDVVENQIEVKTHNVITDIPNDVNVPEPEIESPVVIPDEVAEEILKTEISSNDSCKVNIPEPKTGTCNLCGKTMLSKNLRYAHPKVCRNRPPQKHHHHHHHHLNKLKQ